MVRLTDRPDMTLDVYRGRKTTIQPTNQPTNSISIYLLDLLNIDNPYFEGMLIRIYYPELHLNKAIKLMRLVPKPNVWIYISQFQTDLFHP